MRALGAASAGGPGPHNPGTVMSPFTGLRPKEDIMLERCFRKASTVRRLRGGPAGSTLDGFAESLLAKGYSPKARATGGYLYAADHLADWAARRGIPVEKLDEEVLGRFLGHLPCRCRGRKHCDLEHAPFRIYKFLDYLRAVGVASPAPGYSVLVVEYGAWMRKQCGLAESTIARSQPVVEALLDTVGEAPSRFDAKGVHDFVLAYVQKRAPRSARSVTTIIRCFLRYLVTQGQCSPDLIEAVPRVPTWRMATLPRYLADTDVERIIEACDRESAVALRDRAMLLLLARLGLRAGDIAGLRLDDIDWQHGRLRVVGKGRRETRLPLPQDAGDAILAYLKDERPALADDHVFFTARTPIRPMTTDVLRTVVRDAIERAGIQAPFRGTHVLRHSLATRLLREGASLDTIGAVLRHRNVNTTAIYSKVDVGVLQQVAQPWPAAEVAPC